MINQFLNKLGEFSVELHVGVGQGFDVIWGKWENQHAKGVYFAVQGGIFCFEFRTDRSL